MTTHDIGAIPHRLILKDAFALDLFEDEEKNIRMIEPRNVIIRSEMVSQSFMGSVHD